MHAAQPFRVAQVSDAHLSPRMPGFARNFALVAQAVRAAAPDLLVATGDLSLDGAGEPAELAQARDAHAAIGCDWVAIPGNHDVGDTTLLPQAQPVGAARLRAWEDAFGTLGFLRDAPGWRLVGLDTQSLPDACGAAQWAALEQAVAGAPRVALFLHKPLMIDAAEEAERGPWALLHEARARLLAQLRPAFVASGHVHQWRDHAPGGLRQVWAPATSFILGDRFQRRHGEKCLGWVEHILHADGRAEHQLHRVPGLVEHDLGEMPEVYGPHEPLGRIAGGVNPPGSKAT